jgi:N-acetylglutamate synthase-like GNAT family acetyltransferase
MDSSNYRVRRATLDDLPQLVQLWQSMHLAVDELGKRITEFQIVEGADGKLLGAVGLQITARHGSIHSEAFVDFSLADALRPVIWERIQSVARNHGLLRLWTQEKAPFWSHCGLMAADAESLQKLPSIWRTGDDKSWLTLKLRDDLETIMSLDKEFAMFMESEKQNTARTFQQARVLKMVATLIALAVLVLVLAGAFIVVKNNPRLLGR